MVTFEVFQDTELLNSLILRRWSSDGRLLSGEIRGRKCRSPVEITQDIKLFEIVEICLQDGPEISDHLVMTVEERLYGHC